MSAERSVELVLDYHRRTKHAPGRYARSLGYLDWANQPDPFRRFEGAPRVGLEIPAGNAGPDFAELGSEAVACEPAGAALVSRLFFDSMAISAWKSAGGPRWALRCNPSSGNLHPTEAYLITGPIEGLLDAPAVLHYASETHALEVRRRLDDALRSALVAGLDEDVLLVALSTIPWRESWKYGERAFRYCQHDVGHAVGALGYAARAAGWDARLLGGISDPALGALLALSDAEDPEVEHPDLLLAISRRGAVSPAAASGWRAPHSQLLALGDVPALGEPNRLSREHHPWPVIETIATATRRASASGLGTSLEPSDPLEPRALAGRPAREIFRTRRSAVAMDGESGLDRARFLEIVEALLPRRDAPLASIWPWAPAVDVAFWVHRVEGLEPGLLLLVRDPSRREALAAALDERFAWEPVAGERMPLHRLADGDVRRTARALSCGQEIASDGAFAVSFIAEFRPRLDALGAWAYRALHWEAGLLGQILYLEAEAAGLRGTGIGCYFDDPTHEVLGLRDERFQVLYHFTVGRPVEDSRIQTLPAYP